MIVKNLAITVLKSAEPADKIAAAHLMFTQWRNKTVAISDTHDANIPDIPGRPALPELVDPRDVKRRRIGTQAGRVALLHAIAHIEFNAIDLAADMVARFADSPRIAGEKRNEFISDWVGICADEARHFTMINARLLELDSHYGALTAHNGLWQAALKTSHDLAARLVIAPMVLEARGLDVTPGMIEKLKSVSDAKSAKILGIIYDEEIPHVAAGTRWFTHICDRENRDPENTFKSLVKTYYQGTLNPPFNDNARSLAGMPTSFYQP
ncbi:MAG: ferritin-like domain-containing protein [Robiginitomaculum sp.]|nr:ferritin-like domain-containing protein [Robiginitomaculum sp.]